MNGSQHQGSVRCSCWHSTNPRIILSGGDDRTIRLWRLYPHNALHPSNNNNNDISSSNGKTTNKSSQKQANKLNGSHDSILSDSNNSSDSEDDVELTYDPHSVASDDDDPNKFMTDFDPSIQSLSHLLSMPASGEVKAICMSPYNGEILVATSSRLFNQKSSLDIINIPHWTWNYSSTQRKPYKVQLRERYKLQQQLKQQQLKQQQKSQKTASIDSNELNLVISSLDDDLDADQQEEEDGNNPFIENQSNPSISSDFVNRPSVIPLPYGARERCIAFSPSPDIVFVGLLSCRKKHQRRYCCLMACNILNGASRPCKKINALLARKECIYSIRLTCCDTVNDENENEEKKQSEVKQSKQKIYRLALGTNLGRLLIVTLKQDLSWTNTRRSFITEYTVAFEEDPLSTDNNKNGDHSSNLDGKNNTGSSLYGASYGNNSNGNDHGKNSNHSSNKNKKSKHHRKTSSKNIKYSVLTARERCFREMADPTTVMITYESMKKYLWNESSQIEEQDIREFFQFMKPNKKNQITFTQFVQRVDEDGNFMRAFEQFCLTGSSRTDRRAWMDDNNGSDDDDGDGNENDAKYGDEDEDDSDWELAMLNHRSGDKLNDESATTAIAWSGNDNDNWIITGHQDGDIKFWSKEYYPSNYTVKQNKYLRQSAFYYVCRGSMKRHSEPISCLSLSGTYLVSSSHDGNILIWHLDFLLPSVNLPMNITLSSRGIIQLLATINSAHLGDEICDVQLSRLTNNVSYCMPNALYLLSCGADENIRCRDVMEILRQQLTLRILAESNQQSETQHIQNENGGHNLNRSDSIDNIYKRYESFNPYADNPNIKGDSDDDSDFGATTYD